jgi:UPF0755 protein
MSGGTPSGRQQGLLSGVMVVIILLALAAMAIVLGMYLRFQDSMLNLPEAETVYAIAPGTSLNQLAHDLERRGIIAHPRLFILLGRELDVARHLKAGEYTLVRGMTPRSLLETVVEGRVLQYRLTLVEGRTFREVMQNLAAHPAIRQTLAGLDDGGIMERLGHPGVHPEGRFLPDTYHFPRGTTDLEFLARAYTAMTTVLEREWKQREADLPLASPEEALILASVVEKETGLATERARIAGVFIRRLQKGMKLQTDPTVIYGLGGAFDGNLRKRDLLKDTPYNTYTRDGLPPTPIAMPGVDAIRAALHPADGDDLYFVAMGDGRHYFSGTLQEHNLAVQKFQLGRTDIRLPVQEARP